MAICVARHGVGCIGKQGAGIRMGRAHIKDTVIPKPLLDVNKFVESYSDMNTLFTGGVSRCRKSAEERCSP